MSYSVYIIYLKRELKMFSASPAESEISFDPAPAPATANKVTTTEAKGRREPAPHGVLSSLAGEERGPAGVMDCPCLP
jgi:hypothetical protein